MRDQALGDFNTRAWVRGDFVGDYSESRLNVADALLFARYTSALAGRVLELGPGTGRLTRMLVGLASEVHAIDVSPRMVEACRQNVPEAHVELGDLRRLDGLADSSFEAVVAGDNVIDVVSDAERRRVLREFRRVLVPGGLVLFSSHNHGHLGYVAPAHIASAAALRSPRKLLSGARDARARLQLLRNRRRARRFEYHAADYAIVNDGVHENRLVLYFIGRDAQDRQLADAGFSLLECIDGDGRNVGSGARSEHSYVLYYAARAA